MFRKMTAADSGKKKDRDITLETYWERVGWGGRGRGRGRGDS